MTTTVAPTRLSADFWKFFAGQTISNLGTSVTAFALPLLVYQLTGSAINLGLTMALALLPNLCFGLFIGAWVDRVDRKRLMVAVDILQGLCVAAIPAAALLGGLSIGLIYAVVFLNGLLTVCFQAAEFAAIPSLVPSDDLVTANGRIQASYSAAMVLGPLLGGLLLGLIPVVDLLLLDAASFAISGLLLSRIRRSFNAAGPARSTSIVADVREGLVYVWGHPVLRNISLMMCMVNLIGASVYAQIVLFVSERYAASEGQVGVFFSAGSVGVIALSLGAGLLRRRFGFSKVALGALMLNGLLIVAMALAPWYAAGVVLWALASGLGIMFNINTGSLRQAIVPGHLLGRVISVAMVIGLSAVPLGALAGGWVIERSGDIALVYLGIGLITFLIPLGFSFTALGRAEQYIPAAAAGDPTQPEPEPALA